MILLTGAAGYIGSACRSLNNPSNMIKIDRAITRNTDYRYIQQMDLNDRESLLTLFRENNIDVVVHLAADISVAESVANPYKYYSNNIQSTLNLISVIQELKQEDSINFIFASTAAAFDPISPYAKSKLICEEMIRSVFERRTIFRFFNVAGAGQYYKQIGKSTHLIRSVAAALNSNRPITIFGNDYDTPDGTCIREYIHISDLVHCIYQAVYKSSTNDFECLGNHAASNLEIVNMMKLLANKKDHPIIFAPRRPGDVAILTTSEHKSTHFMSDKKSLKDICESTLSWQN